MKVIKPMSTPDGQNIYINYSKRALPYNIEMHPHVNVRVIPMTEFVHSDEKYAKFDQMAANGTIHPIDKIGHCYCRDYMIFNGQYDVSLRIPPMPARTYEIRFGYKNQGSSNGGESDNKNQGMSMVQVYIDGKVAYRAEDFGISNLHIRKGAVPDEQTYDNGVENDKLMRNLGYMKAPDCYYVYTGNKKIVARESARHTRCIVARQHWSEKEHWIRFRSVGDRLQALLLDYIELVPLNIINDPTKPEDRH